MIVFRTGDLFEDKGVQAYAHGVNCAGVMRSGIAVEFARRYPLMYELYKSRCEKGKHKSGDCLLFYVQGVDGVPSVFNLFTQIAPARGSASYTALRLALREMRRMADEHGIVTTAMPRVGCGLGGLLWPVVHALIIEEMSDWSGTLYIYERG